MRISDLTEALKCAGRVFRTKYGVDMEIFHIEFNEDEYDGDMHVQAVGEVVYETGGFGHGSKRGLKPHADIRIHFEIEDGKIEDRSVTIEDLS